MNTEILISVSVIVVNFCTDSGIRDEHALSNISSQSLPSYQRGTGELTISHIVNYCIITWTVVIENVTVVIWAI